jgi:hypothetical protein
MNDAKLTGMREMGWKRIALFGLIGILLLGAFYGIYLGWVKKDMSDFGVCYRAGQRILWGETMYRTADGHLQYKYAPVSAIFYSAFASLPYEVAKVIWYYLELICLFAAFWISYRCLPSRENGTWFVIGLGLLIFAKYTGREIELGQVNIFIIFLLVLMLLALIKKKEVASGALWGISVFFKPYALVFLPYFLLKKRFRIVVSGLAVLAIGLVAPALIFGWQGNLVVLREWVGTLSHSTPNLLAVSDNASLYAFLWKLLGWQQRLWVEILFGTVFAAIGAVFLWMMWQGKKSSLQRPETLEAAFLFTLIPLFSPLGWYYNYLYALPAVVLLLNDIGRFPPALKYILAGNFLVIGGSLREILGKTLFRFYNRKSLMVINSLVVLFYLAYVRLKKRA